MAAQTLQPLQNNNTLLTPSHSDSPAGRRTETELKVDPEADRAEESACLSVRVQHIHTGMFLKTLIHSSPLMVPVNLQLIKQQPVNLTCNVCSEFCLSGYSPASERGEKHPDFCRLSFQQKSFK